MNASQLKPGQAPTYGMEHKLAKQRLVIKRELRKYLPAELLRDSSLDELEIIKTTIHKKGGRK